MVLALVRDLLFSSKITVTARSAGVDVRVLRRPDDLADADGDLLLVDLNQAGVIEAAAAWHRRTACQVVGFVSHVDADTAAKAKAAGIKRVLARSRFVELLPNLLVEPRPAAGPLHPKGSE